MKDPGISEERMGDITKVAKGAGLSFAGSAVGRLLLFLSNVAIARLFGAEVFGVFVLGLVVVRLAEVLSRLGLDTGSMRFVSIHHGDDAPKTRGVVFCAFFLSIASGVVAGLLLYLCSGFIASSIFGKPELAAIIKGLAFSIPFLSATYVAAGATQGFHTTKYSVYIKELFQPASYLVLLLCVFYGGFGIEGVIAAFVVSYVASTVLGAFLLRGRLATMGAQGGNVYEVKALLGYSMPLVFIALLGLVVLWADTIMVGYFLSSEMVGIYRAASQPPLIMAMALAASNSIYAPVVAELFNKGERDRLDSIFKMTARWGFYLTLPVLIVIVFSSTEIMALFGEGFVGEGAPVLVVLAVAHFLNCAASGAAYTLAMTGRQNIVVANLMVTLLFNVALNVILIPLYGVMGAALATAVTFTFIGVVTLLEVFWIYRIQPYTRGYIKGLVAGAISVPIIMAVQQIGITDRAVSFAVKLLVTGGVFLLVFSFTEYTREDRHLLDKVKAKLQGLTAR